MTDAPPTVYIGDEGDKHKSTETEAVLRAVPDGVDPTVVNGINIGAGGRRVHPSFLSFDAHRGAHPDLPAMQTAKGSTWLGSGEDLSFKNNTIDVIVSQRIFEHLSNPVNAALHYLHVVKPGGGVGIVTPNAFFCWDPAKDQFIWGHCWRRDPVTVCKMHHKY